MKKNYLGMFLLLLIAAIPFNIERKIWGVWVTTSDVLAMGAIVAWVMKIILNTTDRSKLSFPLGYVVGGLLGVFLLTACTAMNPMLAAKEAAKYVLLFGLFYVLVNEINDESLLRWIPLLIFGTSVVLSAWFLYDFFARHLPYYYMKNWERYPFSNLHFNLLGSYLVLAIPMGFYILQKYHGLWKRICIGSLMVIQGGGLLFTYSRLNWIVLVLIVLSVMVIKYKVKGLLISLLLLAMPLGVISSLRVDYRLKERIISIFNPKDGSLAERKALENAALDMIRLKPLTGVGLNNFSLAGKKLLNRDLEAMVHNIYLQFWAEAGIFSLLLFLCIIMFYYLNAWQLLSARAADSSMTLLLTYGTMSFTALLLSNQFGDPFVRILKEHFVILLAIPYIIRNIRKAKVA